MVALASAWFFVILRLLEEGPIADIEVEVLGMIGSPVSGSCCLFCNNCLALQLAAVEDVFQVSRDNRSVSRSRRLVVSGELLSRASSMSRALKKSKSIFSFCFHALISH